MRLYEGAEINRLNHKMYHIPSFSLREAPFYVGIRKRGTIVSDIFGFKYIGLRIYQLTFDPVCDNKHWHIGKNAAKIQKEPVGGLGGGNFEHNFPTSLSFAKYFQHFSTHASPLHSSPKESKQKWKWWNLCPTIDQHKKSHEVALTCDKIKQRMLDAWWVYSGELHFSSFYV